jgi:EAL domain-containing protein (putative c-di-GMP-specific phosphodiesterase class I)
MIRDGLDRGRFHLVFQPVVSARTGQLKGFESLLRMVDNDGHVISPKDFVPVAEDIGLITPIGTWALREACRTAGYWPENLSVAVNLSPAQFVALTTRDETISQVVAHVLAETGLKPERLELEITEGLFLEHSDIVMRELEALKALGVAIVLDDFGTGYSSLAYLWKFPFDKLKIDQSFVHLLTKGDVKMTSFVRTIASLGHTLNLKVTAEGIETYEQAAFVRALGVDSIQGFLFGRPRPSTELDEWILDPQQVIAIDLPYAETSPLVPDPMPPIVAAPPRPDTAALSRPDTAALPPSNSTRLTERTPIRAPYQPKPRALTSGSPATAPKADAEPVPVVDSAPEAEDRRPQPPAMTALQAATMGRYSGGVRVTVRPGIVRPAPSKV